MGYYVICPRIWKRFGNPEEFAVAIGEKYPALSLIKFGATWCKPCMKIEAQVKDSMLKLPDKFKCYIIDIDDYLEVVCVS
jgi:thiol-disulfide isomerase/thioredoxin